MGPRTGKQIAVAMTVQDERKFLAFLRTTADVQILALNSPQADRVWLDAFPPRRSRDTLSTGFLLWSRAFEWTPEVKVDGHGVAGVVNGHPAPVIEYLRHPFFVPAPNVGRLFWSRGMTADGPYQAKDGLRFSYDPEAFDVWWQQVIQWVRAHSHHRTDGRGHIHYLPWAWWRYGKWGLS